MTGDASSVRTALTRGGRTIRPAQATPPIRQVLADRRALVATARERAQSPFQTLRHYAVTTPGKLIIICTILALGCLGTGLYASTVLENRTQTLQRLIDRTEPLAEAAQVLYSSLSIADASASAAFISGGLESPELRQRYSDALATAASSLILATGTSSEPGSGMAANRTEQALSSDLKTLSTSIPVYSGLIETARTNNRLGNPVGSAYLGQASSMMQDQILPAAQRLYERRSMAIADPQRSLTRPPWTVYTGLLLLLTALVLTSRYLARRTRRRFNIGIVSAVMALAIGTLWLLASGLLSVAATSDARTDGADPLRELTAARILTQQARSAETLSLIRRGDQGGLERTFSAATNEIGKIVDEVRATTEDGDSAVSTEQLDAVTAELREWQRTDAAVRRYIQIGDFSRARLHTVGDGPDSSASAYTAVDTGLVDAITTARTSFRDDINTAQRVLGFTGTGILLLTLFAAIAVVGGLIPRIREYR
ncbi:hypothetical protein IA539_04370 [Gordonia sp. zg691]|uniref:Chemotaxis methyl-accepting receptor HlyB-like 4HB MCP domain-containing protein n=1 Tax=Gordonia jinghuaiqii TaxID=2758710 RepID=A0A7D7QWQ8_9ACTN|nr:hypothetical protein [Gordonia jinghuaiqii]MBD0860442.1 hypothetical protein [Gordonia jinghuaiqii]MCR5978288.1 hypothetical protein [Gordonia jinghuaiqii]QMT01269.1 hypothetical protein H1R19_20935 [Gordonia jinghuaiqii]